MIHSSTEHSRRECGDLVGGSYLSTQLMMLVRTELYVIQTLALHSKRSRLPQQHRVLQKRGMDWIRGGSDLSTVKPGQQCNAIRRQLETSGLSLTDSYIVE